MTHDITWALAWMGVRWACNPPKSEPVTHRLWRVQWVESSGRVRREQCEGMQRTAALGSPEALKCPQSAVVEPHPNAGWVSITCTVCALCAP